MTQQAREVSEFGGWIDHFEQNATVHARVDSAIDFDAECRLSDSVRRPLLDAIGYRRTRFVRDVFRDFAKVAAEMLLNRRVATYDTRTDG
jgi:hypothetical protein